MAALRRWCTIMHLCQSIMVCLTASLFFVTIEKRVLPLSWVSHVNWTKVAPKADNHRRWQPESPRKLGHMVQLRLSEKLLQKIFLIIGWSRYRRRESHDSWSFSCREEKPFQLSRLSPGTKMCKQQKNAEPYANTSCRYVSSRKAKSSVHGYEN